MNNESSNIKELCETLQSHINASELVLAKLATSLRNETIKYAASQKTQANTASFMTFYDILTNVQTQFTTFKSKMDLFIGFIFNSYKS